MPESVLTLGTFDGVHRGHQALLKKVIARARALGVKSVVLSFGMPPRHAGESLVKPVLLTMLSEKLGILKSLGIDHVQVLNFDRKTATTQPEEFFLKTIQKMNGAREMVVGPRVAFGRNRSGRLALLKRLGKSHGVRVHVVSSIAGGRRAISSRRIRALLTHGQIEAANALLGYPYSAAGKVVHGDHRGRRLGFPTANIQVASGKILPRGVFWVKVLSSGFLPLRQVDIERGIDGLCNVGVRPTFTPRAHELHCEVFMFPADGQRRRPSLSLYGQELRVVFLRRIRGERRFASSEALQRQIAKDLCTAKLYKNAYFSI